MKYFSHICGRLALTLLLAAFLSTTAVAGLAQLGLSCCGDCCTPRAHHSAGTAKVKLSSAMPMQCCSGISNQTCDLSTQPKSLDSNQYRGITSTVDGSPTAAANGQTIRTSSGSLILKKPSPDTNYPETTPIYLEFQSFLI